MICKKCYRYKDMNGADYCISIMGEPRKLEADVDKCNFFYEKYDDSCNINKNSTLFEFINTEKNKLDERIRNAAERNDITDSEWRELMDRAFALENIKAIATDHIESGDYD